jgi:hypothetical protein
MPNRLLAILIAAGLCLQCRTALALSGVVQDMNGKPISGAVVRIVIDAMGVADPYGKVSTDSTGRFSFLPTEKPAKGAYLIFAFAEGFCFDAKRIGLSEDKNVVLSLRPEYVLRGRIVDETGEPVVGAAISMASMSGTRKSGESLWYGESFPDGYPISATSDEAGFFELKQMPGSEGWGALFVTLLAEKTGFAATATNLEVQGKRDDMQSPLTITLPHVCSVSGVLHLPDEQPSPSGVPITLATVSGKSFSTVVHTDREGRFSQSGLPPGDYVFALGQGYWYSQNNRGEITTPAALDWALPPKTITVKPPGVTDIRLTMTRGAIIGGRVVDRITRKPIQGALIFARLEGSPDAAVPTGCVTGANGEFRLRTPAGNVVLAVYALPGKMLLIFQPDELPTLTLAAKDGETRSDIVFPVSRSDSISAYTNDGNAARGKSAIENLRLNPGSYPVKWDQSVILSDGASPPAKISARLRAKIRKTPRFVSKNPCFASVQLDGLSGDSGALVIALDESGGTGTGWDTAYIDGNRNLDLSDDKPVTWKLRTGSSHYTSPWTDVMVRVAFPGQKPVRKRIRVALDLSSWSGGPYVSLIRQGAWKCTIGSNKGAVECIVADMNRNGVWGDPEIRRLDAKPGPRLYRIHYHYECTGDYLFLDNNGYGHAVAGWSSPHGVRLNNWTRIAGHYYAFGASRGALTVRAAAPSLGKLHVFASNFGRKPGRSGEIMLSGEQGVYEIETRGEPIELPAGKWRIDDVTFNINSAITPGLQFRCEFGKTITIKPGKQLDIDLGGRLLFAFDRIGGVPGQEVHFCWWIPIGGVGHAYFMWKHPTHYESDLDKFAARVYDKAGKQLLSTFAEPLSASYDGRAGARINIPNLPPGEYRLEMEMSAGPELGALKGSSAMTILQAGK